MGEDDGKTAPHREITCGGCDDEMSGRVDACEDQHLQHFSHPHPLKLSNYKEEELMCNGCKKPISGKSYGCYSCGYYLHEFCGYLPLEIQHFFHPCTLFLEITNSSRVNCDACLGKCSENIDFGYHCKKCNFKMHWECAQLRPIGSDDDEDKGEAIRHLSHHHPLKLNSEESRGECNLCRRGITTGQVYGACDPCQFYIHESCMVSEQIQHRCHPCRLFLRLVRFFECNICLRGSRHSFAYQCIKCRFNMHVECADQFSSSIIVRDPGKRILHFCHQHPLQPFEDLKRNTRDMILNKKLQCFVCGSLSSGLTYGCKECDVFLHKPCLDILPQTLSIQNNPSSVLVRSASRETCTKCYKSFSGFFFDCGSSYYCVPCALLDALSFRVNPSSIRIEHPFHRCPLILKLSATFSCNACFTHCSTHAFYCGRCDFYVGLKCAQLSTTSVLEDEWIQHSCHWHPLRLLKDSKLAVAPPCKICGILLLLEPCYFCSECDFHVHKSCLDILPQNVDHHYSGCSLVLVTTLSYKCVFCRKDDDSGLAFRSIESGSKLCMKCFFWPKNKLNVDGTFTSIHHWHRLSLVDNLKEDIDCLLCGGGCDPRVMYHCKQCQGYFHKSCAELPFEIENPLHPVHSLTLISTSRLGESRRSCSLCLREFPTGDTPLSGIYHCKECDFQLDRKCASTCVPSIQYQGEPHLLTVVDHIYDHEDCRVCSTTCKSSTNVFRCAECKFSLHLTCGPLPCDIKHPCHVHPLTLEDFYVEENYTDKFPCYVCEEVRDPMLPVYRCAEGCPMICEIKCAINEVMPKLLGHHGGAVELRTVFPRVKSKVIPRDEIFKDMVDDDASTGTTRRARDINLTFEAVVCSRDYNWETTNIIETWERELLQSHDKELEAADEDEDADMNSYALTREAFNRFSSKLGHTLLTLKTAGIPEFILQHRGPEGEVSLLPKSLVPIHKELFPKFDQSSDRWRGSKPYFSSILCAVVHNMRMTKVVDVTSERVRQWLTLLDLVQRAGFDTGFAVDKIKHVWEAHFLVKAKALLDDTSDRLHREHERLSNREEELLRELEDTREEREKIKEQEEHHHRYKGNGMKSLRKEYAEALLIKWKPASAAILDQPHDELLESSYSTEAFLDASTTPSHDSWMTSNL